MAACVVTVLVLGVLLTQAAAFYARTLEQGAAQDELDRRAEVARWALTHEVRRYQDTVGALAAAAGAQQDLTKGEFAELAAPLARARFAGASGVTFITAAGPADVAAASAFWQGRGAEAFAPEGGAAEHLFAVFGQSLDGTPTLASGRDLSAIAPVVQTLELSRRTGTTAVSDTYVLLKDRDLPVAEQQQSLVFAAPVYGASWFGAGAGDDAAAGDVGGAAASPSRPLRGWVMMPVRTRTWR